MIDFNVPLPAGETMSAAMKKEIIKTKITDVLRQTDWTDLPNSGLTLSQQIEQQELRLAWMELDDPDLDPDEIVLPPYPMTERP